MDRHEQEVDAGDGPIISSFAADDDMKELITIFVKELDTHVESLRHALEARNFKLLAAVSHQIKGAAGGYGFLQIGDSAATVAQVALADEANLNEVRERAEDLIQLCHRAAVQVDFNTRM